MTVVEILQKTNKSLSREIDDLQEEKEVLKILLKNTIETLEDQCDFNSAEHFIEFLIEETGITPEEYNELYKGEQYIDETGALKKVME